MRGTIPLIIALSASADAYAAMGLSRSAPVIRHRAPPSFAPAPTPLRTPQSAATMMALNAPPALTSAVKTSLSLGGIVGVDAVLRRVFAANSIPFPSALAGMLGLFSMLCTLQATAPRAASKIASAAQPGCDFISRWLALFFVPNLVVLPLVLQMSAAEFGKLLAVIVLGLGASLPLAALTATAMLDVTKEAGPTAEAAASAQWKSGGAAEWKAPVKQYLLDPPLLVLSGASAVCMGLSLAGIGRAAAFNVHLRTTGSTDQPWSVASPRVVRVASPRDHWSRPSRASSNTPSCTTHGALHLSDFPTAQRSAQRARARAAPAPGDRRRRARRASGSSRPRRAGTRGTATRDAFPDERVAFGLIWLAG